MSEATNKLLRRFAVLYGSPDSPDEDAFFDEYRSMLAKCSPAVIALAGDILRDSHLAKRWPTPGEVKVACTTAAKTLDPPKRAPEHIPFKVDDEPQPDDPEAKARVKVMLAEFMAKRTEVADAAERLPDVRRPAFERMQRESPNAGLHRVLSPVSRRMTGERD